ncbi:P-II family nitrogen regulator [Thermosulfuriphilus ammonigenes]|uniref:P-II family nitrogen regulator n=1 Tax=Thermosulfuriphilus ammonigenes TaxID=1936021 RepID=A0A6G7PUJ2_9BACT|nr:P-II family nitrogen regulator [Thermosulfuriphilus ammonigenes]MBA2848604.1 nitrogen regulatory protein PII 2 [Thermosulfuriphilus ammonigenes]QIJ71257.1 P-II family nitrogen regulator [Thermosulfuriphilus ammonigenes]
MKEVLAVIRMNKINQTKKALVEAGYPAFHAVKALGRGRRPVDFKYIEALNEDPEDSADALAVLAQGPRLIPKRMISLIVPDAKVSEVIQTIIKVNQTGNPGDGKIFVMPISDVIRVRTGESGETAIDEMTGK